LTLWREFLNDRRNEKRAQVLASRAGNMSIVSLMRAAKEKRLKVEQMKVQEQQLKIQQAAARKVCP
jgi:hypothetical protein